MAKPMPLVCDAHEARRILEGAKTQVRYPVPWNWWRCLDPEDAEDRAKALLQSPYRVGRIHVKEPLVREEGESTRYLCDGTLAEAVMWEWGGTYLPPTRMPRWAARIFVEILAVSIEPLIEITEEDAVAEGWGSVRISDPPRLTINDQEMTTSASAGGGVISARDVYRSWWDSRHPPGMRWANEPWVWKLEYRRVE